MKMRLCEYEGKASVDDLTQEKEVSSKPLTELQKQKEVALSDLKYKGNAFSKLKNHWEQKS